MQYIGLDQVMLIEFNNLGMRITAMLGLPLFGCLAPLHLLYGGNAAGDDNLSKLGMANVVHGSQLVWAHAFFAWYVVAITQFLIFDAMKRFMDLRARWLADMSAPRATTLLVEEIPEGKNTEAEMRRYFDDLVFRRPSVRVVQVVKDTSELDPLLERLKVLRLELEKKGPEKPSILAEVAGLEASTKMLQEQIDTTDELNTFNAFVTFRDRQDATIVLKIFSPDDEEEIVATVPPAPEDIIWRDLLADPLRQTLRDYLGMACIAGLFFSFLPCIVGLSAITDLESVRAKMPALDAFVGRHPAVQSLWNGLLGGVAIIIMMSMLPTFLMMVFRAFWVNRGECFLQQRLQYYYFWFLIVFVLLITAIGSSLIETSAKLIEHPTMVFALLANTLPKSTHFYLNYLPIQWTTHAIGLTRNSTLFKFFLKKRFYEERRALELAEPEDQDYFGMGSRSARFTLTLVITLVFSTLSPLIVVLGWVEFFLGRIVYSYLFMYAETRKADLGGAFFCAAAQECSAWTLHLHHTDDRSAARADRHSLPWCHSSMHLSVHDPDLPQVR